MQMEAQLMAEINEKKVVLNRNFKDSVFRIIFNNPRELIELYNAIYGTEYGPDTPVDIIIIKKDYMLIRRMIYHL